MERMLLHGLLTALCVMFFAVILRPLALDLVDFCYGIAMTEEERKAAMGLPFPVSPPPEAESRMLNRAQIRWVLIQEIRMDVMNTAINHENASAVAAFQALVDDYNARGASYTYEAADMRSACEDVAAYREVIREHAIEEVLSQGWDKKFSQESK